uniref:Uncharacterized protein n=1 Tax=Peronospora matthiolae TaxID=2874970 RepID=A0AAV1V9E3_9STRA
MFFDYVLNALYGSCGVDMCFSLLRELSANELAIPDEGCTPTPVAEW